MKRPLWYSRRVCSPAAMLPGIYAPAFFFTPTPRRSDKSAASGAGPGLRNRRNCAVVSRQGNRIGERGAIEGNCPGVCGTNHRPGAVGSYVKFGLLGSRGRSWGGVVPVVPLDDLRRGPGFQRRHTRFPGQSPSGPVPKQVGAGGTGETAADGGWGIPPSCRYSY